MIKIIKTFLIVFSLSAVFNHSFISNVYADLGVTPIYSQGGTLLAISPSTNVSMDYEKVILTYGQPQRKYDNKGREWDATMTVHVSAVFKMKNNGTQVEKLTVYFPSSDSTFVGGSGGDDITNFKVNGKSLAKESLGNIPLIIEGNEEKILAYEWQETFNPQQINEITVEYDTKSGKDFEVYYLTYVLGTGRGWQRNIKQGEINFVLPENLVSYSVLNKAPMVKENKLPFKVFGNTVTVSFSEYEPSSDDVIVLGVYEFNKVGAIEQLKNEPQTFANVLKIAGLFRELSGGPHCAFCIGIASRNAEDYYNLALDKATSKDELNSVLKSFAYGDGDWGNASDLLKMISLKGCEVDNLECKANIYVDRDKLGETPFRLDVEKGQVGQSDFLIKYANKIQTYDTVISASINSYISGAKEASTWWKQRYPQTQTIVSPTPSQVAEPTSSPTQGNTNLQQIIGAGLAIVAILLIVLFWIIRKRNLIKTLTPEVQAETKNEMTETDSTQISEIESNSEKKPITKNE